VYLRLKFSIKNQWIEKYFNGVQSGLVAIRVAPEIHGAFLPQWLLVG
jgi:hypothetical protein